jgi:tetratricopeptide (TPR) repeat protein
MMRSTSHNFLAINNFTPMKKAIVKNNFYLSIFLSCVGTLSTSPIVFTPAARSEYCEDVYLRHGDRHNSLSSGCSERKSNREQAQNLDRISSSLDRQLRQYPQGSGKYLGLIADTSQEPSFYANRGATYLKQGQYQQAISDYSRAIELDPKNAVTYSNRGGGYFELGKYQEAVADHTKAIELDPNQGGYYTSRGNSYHLMKDYQRAFADCDKAISLGSKDPAGSYNCRGNALFRMNNFQAATADYDRSIQIDPDSAAVYFNRGRSHYYLKNRQLANSDFDKAVSICQSKSPESTCKEILIKVSDFRK